MEEPVEPTQAAERFQYMRVYSDDDGDSHFSEEEMPFTLTDFAPPAPGISVSKVTRAESVAVIFSPVGWYGEWHPAPRRQLMFCLGGELEVEVSDGEIRRIGPGAVTLVEDTTGQGHISRVVGDERAYIATVFLKDG